MGGGDDVAASGDNHVTPLQPSNLDFNFIRSLLHLNLWLFLCSILLWSAPE